MGLSVLFYPVFEFLVLGVLIILLYCMFASLYPIIVIANIFEITGDEEEEENKSPSSSSIAKATLSNYPSPFHRHSSERGSSSFLRDTTSSADGGRGSNYNFYVDADEDSDEDEAHDFRARGTNDIEMNPIFCNPVTEIVNHTPMMERGGTGATGSSSDLPNVPVSIPVPSALPSSAQDK